MQERKLTTKQELFIQYYIQNNGNGSDAARQAGYSAPVANRTAVENLSKPVIKKEIDKRKAKLLKVLEEKTGMTYEWKIGLLKQMIVKSFESEDPLNFKGLLSESNKMQGHYVAAAPAAEPERKGDQLNVVINVSNTYIKEY